MNLPLTPQERQIIEEAFAPYIQAVIIIAKLRGLNPGTAQLSVDRQYFILPDGTTVTDEVAPTNGVQTHG